MDVLVTVPCPRWVEWMDEGAHPGQEPPPDTEYHYTLSALPSIEPGERVYIVACGKLRGYSPLERIEQGCAEHTGNCLVRLGGAEAVTLLDPGGKPMKYRGFRGFIYRWWDRKEEQPFPNWRRP